VLRSPGQPLDGATRAGMGRALGHDFSQVRIHTDEHAAASARAVHASAYAVGSHIVFGPGRYAPTTGAGQGLLLHELTHVVQQPGNPDAGRDQIPVAPADSPGEREAAGHAAGIVSGPAKRTSGPLLQRSTTGQEDRIHQPLIDRYWRERGTTAEDAARDPAAPSPGRLKYRDIPKEAQIWCVKDTLCAKDPGIVDDVRRNLQVTVAERVDVQKWEFDSSSWASTTVHPTGFSQHGTGTIGLVGRRPCAESVQTLVHEVRHQRQPASSSLFQSEVDAYVFAEKWTIQHGLPGRPALRTTDQATGASVPNQPAIEAHVRRRYGTPASAGGEQIVGHRHPDTTVLRQSNGSTRTRQSQAGDSYLAEPPTLVGQWRVPPFLWTCPSQRP